MRTNARLRTILASLLPALLAACAHRVVGACTSDASCAPGEVCQEGRCLAMMCTEEWDPVCGADARTYSNGCKARLAHVSVEHAGECAKTRPERSFRICGTIRGLRCGEGEYCDFPPKMCQGADLQGVCVSKGDLCAQIYEPVCGCDGKTYGNDCARVQKEVQKDHDGECLPRP